VFGPCSTHGKQQFINLQSSTVSLTVLEARHSVALLEFIKTIRYFIFVGLIALLGGCALLGPQTAVVVNAPPQLDDAVIARMLQNYQPGKTTFVTFKTDSGLEMVELPPRKKGKVEPGPWAPTAPAQGQMVYTVQAGSSWKIYQTSETVRILNGKALTTRKFVVGDHNRVLATLTFDGEDKLVGVSGAP
jgi:hypothetical protein